MERKNFKPITDEKLRTPAIGWQIVELDEVIKINIEDVVVNGNSEPTLADMDRNNIKGVSDGGRCCPPL